MGTSAGTQPSDSQQAGAAGITFEEIERQLKEAEKAGIAPKLDEIKLDGEDIPEAYRGKSVREALNKVQELENTLRASEIARQQALAMANLASSRSAEPAPPAPVPEELITADVVAAAFQEDPAKGVEMMGKMTDQQIRRAAEQFSRRIEPMMSGTVSAIEAEARRKYPDEFGLYKDEIEQTLKGVDRNAMSNPKSWDDLIAYVRGQNPQKLFDHWGNKEREKRETEAHERERNHAGVSMSSMQRAPASSGAPVVDELTREVCRVMEISEDDYLKWSKVS